MEKSIILNRTSTQDQNPKLQLKDCKAFNLSKGWELVNVFEKHISAFKNEDVWKEEIDWAVKNGVKHVIVWNMDRYSREKEEVVLKRIKMLGLMHDLQIHAVNGDAWSDLVESISKIKSMGFIGDAISEFLEKVIKGIEHQRAYRESKLKSDRVKLAVRKKNDKTYSYKGNKWGRKGLPKKTKDRIIEAYNNGFSMRKIMELVKTTDKNGNMKDLSLAVIHKIIKEYKSGCS